MVSFSHGRVLNYFFSGNVSVNVCDLFCSENAKKVIIIS